MLLGAELKDLFTRMPKWPKKSKFINLQGCLNRDLFLVLWLLSEIFVSTVICLKITLFMHQMTFSLNIFMPTDYCNFPNKKKLISMHPIWYKAPPYYCILIVYILHHRFPFSFFSPFANYSTKINMCDPNYFRNTFKNVFWSFSIILGHAVTKLKSHYSIISQCKYYKTYINEADDFKFAQIVYFLPLLLDSTQK